MKKGGKKLCIKSDHLLNLKEIPEDIKEKMGVSTEGNYKMYCSQISTQEGGRKSKRKRRRKNKRKTKKRR